MLLTCKALFLTSFLDERSEVSDLESSLQDENQNMEDFLSLKTEIEGDVQKSFDICAKTHLYVLHTFCNLSYVMD